MIAARALQHAFSPCGVKLFPIRRDLAIDAVGKNKENTMLRKFAAALLATTLIAGPAFAAQRSDSAGSTPTAPTAPAASTAVAPASTHAVTKQAAKPTKMVKHARKHARKHMVRHKVGKMKVSRHSKSMKMHRHHAAAPVKHVKSRKGGTGA
jgi:hypothetical protein